MKIRVRPPAKTVASNDGTRAKTRTGWVTTVPSSTSGYLTGVHDPLEPDRGVGKVIGSRTEHPLLCPLAHRKLDVLDLRPAKDGEVADSHWIHAVDRIELSVVINRRGKHRETMDDEGKAVLDVSRLNSAAPVTFTVSIAAKEGRFDQVRISGTKDSEPVAEKTDELESGGEAVVSEGEVALTASVVFTALEYREIRLFDIYLESYEGSNELDSGPAKDEGKSGEGQEKLVAELIDELGTASDDKVESIQHALCEIGDATVQPLVDRIKNEGTDNDLAQRACTVLIKIESEASTIGLIELFTDTRTIKDMGLLTSRQKEEALVISWAAGTEVTRRVKSAENMAELDTIEDALIRVIGYTAYGKLLSLIEYREGVTTDLHEALLKLLYERKTVLYAREHPDKEFELKHGNPMNRPITKSEIKIQ